jgi:hypothetical protein
MQQHTKSDAGRIPISCSRVEKIIAGKRFLSRSAYRVAVMGFFPRGPADEGDSPAPQRKQAVYQIHRG